MTAQPQTHHESNRAFYDRIAGAYDLISDASERPARLEGVQALHVQPGEHVLEIGFGTGNEILDLADLVGASGRVCGIDISSGMLAVAQRKLAEKSPEAAVDLRVADARSLPYEDNSFDVVYTSFTLELFPEDEIPIVLAEAKRVLRPSGRLGVVSMARPAAGQPSSLLEKTYVWMHRHFPHIVDCRPIDPVAALRAAGFGITSQKGLEIWSLPVGVVVGQKKG